MNTTEFRATLPRGPLVERICQIHAVLNYMGLRGTYDEHAIAVAEHSLREIARYTAEHPYFTSPHSSDGTRTSVQIPNLDPERLARQFQEAGRGIAKAVSNLAAGFKASQEARRAALTPEQRDARSQARYTAAVARERRAGLDAVRSNYVRACRDLGLPVDPTR